MISAQEAFLNSTRAAAQWRHVDDDLSRETVHELIEMTKICSDNGEFEAQFTTPVDSLVPKIKKYLESLGYIVSLDTRRCWGYTDIKWKWG